MHCLVLMVNCHASEPEALRSCICIRRLHAPFFAREEIGFIAQCRSPWCSYSLAKLLKVFAYLSVIASERSNYHWESGCSGPFTDKPKLKVAKATSTARRLTFLFGFFLTASRQFCKPIVLALEHACGNVQGQLFRVHATFYTRTIYISELSPGLSGAI